MRLLGFYVFLSVTISGTAWAGDRISENDADQGCVTIMRSATKKPPASADPEAAARCSVSPNCGNTFSFLKMNCPGFKITFNCT
jgi:hypothetical protein